jgi:hypothetical protein
MPSAALKRHAPPLSSRVTKRRKAPSQRPSPSPSPSQSPPSLLPTASQATTFETQLLESHTEAESTLPDGSELGTVATTEASIVDGDRDRDRNRDRDDDDGDNFIGINWARLKGYVKPLTT